MSDSRPSSDPTVQSAVQAALGAGFVIEREIGGGGMSRVFVATETALARRVAIKVLSPELFQGVSAERFAREVALAAQLQDPHIVPVLTAGATADGLPWYTMPFIEGESLRVRMQRGAVPLDEALRILRDVAEALEYAHGRGVVHRDIKPENILLAGRSAVVADFGIAKALTAARASTSDQAASATLTSVGMSLGTPAYMAPEQVAGDPTDHRADLYAWGMVAYELLAGAHPFAHKSGMQQLMAAQIAEVPASLDDVQPGLPPSLGALVMQCLAKQATQRPESATALLSSLAGTASGNASGARLAATGATASATVPRSRRGLVFAAVGLLAVLGAGGVYVTQRGGPAANLATVSATPSLAVLPFEHQGDSADVYLTEGITDEIRGKLSSVRDLLVIARSSSNSYRNTKRSPQEVAEELGVRYLLTGTVRVVGSGAERRVIVRPELVEITRDGQPQSRWGQPFDVRGADVLGLQGEVAQQVVTAMEVPIVGGADRGRLTQVATRDPQAYDLYLRGRAATSLSTNQSPQALQSAIALLEQAVARDSAYVDAWTLLTVYGANLYLQKPSPHLGTAVRDAAERAQALDPAGVQGAKAMGAYLRIVARDAAGALAANERAVRADPGDMGAAGNLATTLLEVGRVDEALELFERVLRRDPRQAVSLGNYTLNLTLRGRIADARAAAERLRALAPLSPRTIAMRLRIELFAGDTVAARRILTEALQTVVPDELLSSLLDTPEESIVDPGVMRGILARGPDAVGAERWQWLTWQAAWAWRAGDSAATRAWGDSARRVLVRQLQAQSQNVDVRMSYARALAHAARPAEAVREVREAVAMVLRQGADRRGLRYAEVLYSGAEIALLAGDRAQALAWLEEQSALPLRMSPDFLRVDPELAPLRGDPRFERLTAEVPR